MVIYETIANHGTLILNFHWRAYQHNIHYYSSWGVHYHSIQAAEGGRIHCEALVQAVAWSVQGNGWVDSRGKYRLHTKGEVAQ